MSGPTGIAPSNQLFRARAMERVGDTEALDVLPLLPRPIDRLGMLMLSVLLAAATGWAFLGTVARTVSGTGMLIAQGGQLVEAQTTGAGRITALDVRPGMAIEAGAPIATVVAADQEQRLAGARALVEARSANLQRVRETIVHVTEQRAVAAALQRDAQEARVRAAHDRIGTASTQFDIQDGLLRRGLATLSRVNEARDAVNAARQDEAQALTSLAEIQTKVAEDARADADRIAQSSDDLSAAERALSESEVASAMSARIIAPVAGRVVEVRANLGAVVTVGQTVASIETGRPGLDLLAFVPSRAAREVRPGMTVRISPAGTRKEEQGELLGTVMDISAFPMSGAGLRALLQNETLADSLSRQGSPYVARIALTEKPDGGYAWTSSRGEAVALSSGAIAGLEVVSSLHRPADLVLPSIRRFLGF